jgi:hypothetical protein
MKVCDHFEKLLALCTKGTPEQDGGPTAGVDVMQNRKIFGPCREQDPEFSVPTRRVIPEYLRRLSLSYLSIYRNIHMMYLIYRVAEKSPYTQTIRTSYSI